MLLALSNPRRGESVFLNRPGYQVDYQGQVNATNGTDSYYLMVKVPAGISEAILFRIGDQPQGKLSFIFTPGHEPGQGFDVWIERQQFGRRMDRVRCRTS